ncbi:hypothetical protein HNY73_006172 [Argiope bruennichi]|uniref:Uncharacterized protein n=1 Tax=Argiope bruennichi TaxID=94029 RepID=A0A8T0FJ52_ARGBR|nr:hypothetical protein HNY73_006172 [Argiope bruennichi]
MRAAPKKLLFTGSPRYGQIPIEIQNDAGRTKINIPRPKPEGDLVGVLVQQERARTGERVVGVLFPYPGKLNHGRLAGEDCLFLNEAPEKDSDVSSSSAKYKNGSYLGGLLRNPVEMLVEIRAQMYTLRNRTGPEIKKNHFITHAPHYFFKECLQVLKMRKIHGQIDCTIELGSEKKFIIRYNIE